MDEQPTVKLEVVSPVKVKGLGRNYEAIPVRCPTCKQEIPHPIKENNYIDIGVIVWRLDEHEVYQAVNDELVRVISDDATQNKIFDGTGSVYTIREKAGKKVVPFYPYHYEFKIVGKQNIKFTIGEVSEVVELDAAEPDLLKKK